jgi:hypothetical protein
MDTTDLATDLCLTVVAQMLYLRQQMEEAVRLIVDGHPGKARWVLDAALEKTDVGEIRVWQPGEEPF